MGMARVSGRWTHPSGSTAGEDPPASAREPRQKAKEAGPRFDVLLCPQVTPSLPDGLLAGNVSLSARNDDFQGAPDDALRRAQYSRGGHDLQWE